MSVTRQVGNKVVNKVRNQKRLVLKECKAKSEQNLDLHLPKQGNHLVLRLFSVCLGRRVKQTAGLSSTLDTI